MTDQRFDKRKRLRKPEEFRRVFDRRRSVSSAGLTVCGCENNLGYTRIGLSVSRKVGSSVVRNRWKRVLREAFRLSRETLPQGIDLVLIAKDQNPPTLAWLLDELPRLAGQVARKLNK
jgi:ribonuclease P protein component